MTESKFIELIREMKPEEDSYSNSPEALGMILVIAASAIVTMAMGIALWYVL